MCRIDEPFGSHSLEEKHDPTERFQQALEESGATGVLRELLEKHFTTIWGQELGSIETIEKALKTTRQASDSKDKVCLFIKALSANHNNWFQYVYTGVPDNSLLNSFQKRYPGRFAFAKDVARIVFPESPFGFYQCFKDSINVRFEVFVLFYAPEYYGADCHLSPLLFEDKLLTTLGPAMRRSHLWSVFEHLTQWDRSFSAHMMQLYAWNTFSNVPTQETLRFSQAFDYLGTWIASDTQKVECAESYDLFFKFYEYLLNRRSDHYQLTSGQLVNSLSADELEDYKAWAEQWFETNIHEITMTWGCSVPVGQLRDDALETWAHYAKEIYLPLHKELGQELAQVLIDYGIRKDLDSWLKAKSRPIGLLGYGTWGSLWYISSYRDLWKKSFEKQVGNLHIEERLQLLKCYLGYSIAISPGDSLPKSIDLPQENFKAAEESGRNNDCYVFLIEQEDRDWWDSFLRGLADEGDFPKKIYPSWTVAMLDRFTYAEPLARCADKSLGIVRGALVAGEAIANQETVEKLLRILQHQAPEKALRSYLLLLRNTPEPFSTDKLDINRESLCPKTMSQIVGDIKNAHFHNPSRQHLLVGEGWQAEELALLFSLRTWFAQFCLSRLQLRKGERANGENYNPEQVVESSSLWRQGYLKALAELGIDLNGKVHKTVFFTRKFDPDTNVRAVAQECYKAVRREHNKSETAADIRRGLVAAHWWLLLVQRQALGAEIDYEEAKQTRRRLLRRP